MARVRTVHAPLDDTAGATNLMKVGGGTLELDRVSTNAIVVVRGGRVKYVRDCQHTGRIGLVFELRSARKCGALGDRALPLETEMRLLDSATFTARPFFGIITAMSNNAQLSKQGTSSSGGHHKERRFGACRQGGAVRVCDCEVTSRAQEGAN